MKRKTIKVQIRVMADDPEIILKLLKKIIDSLSLNNASITGVLPNRKPNEQFKYRGYLLGEVYE